MGRRSISGGGVPKGSNRIQCEFNIDRTRFRPTLPWVPTETNLRRARARIVQIKAQIAAGTFSFAEEFPDYRSETRLGLPSRTLICSGVFDAFLHHSEARVARGDLAPIALASYRKTLDRVWRPAIGRIVLPWSGRWRESGAFVLIDVDRGMYVYHFAPIPEALKSRLLAYRQRKDCYSP